MTAAGRADTETSLGDVNSDRNLMRYGPPIRRGLDLPILIRGAQL